MSSCISKLTIILIIYFLIFEYTYAKQKEKHGGTTQGKINGNSHKKHGSKKQKHGSKKQKHGGRKGTMLKQAAVNGMQHVVRKSADKAIGALEEKKHGGKHGGQNQKHGGRKGKHGGQNQKHGDTTQRHAGKNGKIIKRIAKTGSNAMKKIGKNQSKHK